MLLGQGSLWLISTLAHIAALEPLEKAVAAQQAIGSMNVSSQIPGQLTCPLYRYQGESLQEYAWRCSNAKNLARA